MTDSVARVVERWLETLESSNTRAAYRRDLEVYRAWLRVARVSARRATARDIGDFRDHCEASGSGASTVNRRMAAVSSFYRHAGSTWGTSDPTRGVERQRLPPTDSGTRLSLGQVDDVWRASIALGSKTAVVVGLVLLDGLTTSELLGLDVDEIHVTRRSVVVTVAGRTGVEQRRLDPRTAGAVRAHVVGRTVGPLLLGDRPSGKRTRLTRFGVDYLVKRAGSSAGLAVPLTVQQLRVAHRHA